MKGVIYVDIGKCLACKTCELSCAVEHSRSKVLCKAIYECPGPQGRIAVESESGINIPLQCRHCEDAPCMKVCPSKAIDRLGNDQPVLINADRCIGCKLCIIACPFGALKMDRSNKAVIKCDMCFERLREGKLPACVAACPSKALKFMTSDEIAKEKRKKYLVSIIRSGANQDSPQKNAPGK